MSSNHAWAMTRDSSVSMSILQKTPHLRMNFWISRIAVTSEKECFLASYFLCEQVVGSKFHAYFHQTLSLEIYQSG